MSNVDESQPLTKKPFITLCDLCSVGFCCFGVFFQ